MTQAIEAGAPAAPPTAIAPIVPPFRTMRRIGHLLLLASFALPFAYVALGFGTGYQLGADLGYRLFGMVVLGPVAFGVTTKGARARAIAVLLVGLTMFTWMHAQEWRIWRIQVGDKKFAANVLEFQPKAAAAIRETTARVVATKPESILTPRNAGTADGQVEARAQLRAYREAIAARALAISRYEDGLVALANTIAEDDERNDAIARTKPGGDITRRLYGALDRSQMAQADAIEELLDWHLRAKQRNAFFFNGADETFSSESERASAAPGFQHYRDASHAVDKALADINSEVPHSETEMQKSLELARQIAK